MQWRSDDLATMSGGNGWRGAAILVVAHLVAGVVAVGLWAFGLLSVFDDLRWIPIGLVATYGLVATVTLLLRFGFWGTSVTLSRSGGEDLESTFSPGVGFGLGWLRWLMQIVLVFIVVFALLLTLGNAQWWQLAGTAELDRLPDLADSIPVEEDWELVDSEATGTGIPDFMDGPQGPEVEGYVERIYEVPASYTFDDLRGWLEHPNWDAGPDAFGAIRIESCRRDSGRCTAHLVPAGLEPEYFVRATLREPSFAAGETEVRIRVTFREYVEPDWDVSDETIERARTIPVPDEWTRASFTAETTNNGEKVTQFFGVPDSYTRDDLEAWLAGPRWTDPDGGETFGEIEVDTPCREVGPGELDRRYLCSAVVPSTRRSPIDDSNHGPVESLSVSLSADHTVRVSLERNG